MLDQLQGGKDGKGMKELWGDDDDDDDVQGSVVAVDFYNAGTAE